MNEILHELFNIMDYDTYLSLKEGDKYLYISSLISAVTGLVNESIPWVLIASILLFGKQFLDSQYLFLNVKEVNEIQKKYQEFLERYSEFIKTFGLNNPMEVMFLFSHLLKNGYLSSTHDYKYSRFVCDYSAISGAQCFTGNLRGINSAKLLTDILSSEGYDAGVLLGYKDIILGDNLGDIIGEDNALNVRNFLIQASNKDVEQIRLNIEAMLRDSLIKLEDFHLPKISWLYPDHGITVSKFNDKVYYLDSNFEAIYRPRTIDNRQVLASGLDIFVPRVTSFSGIDYKTIGENVKKTRRMLKGVEVSLKEELESRRKVEQITTNNQFPFEQFYKENASLYNDISQSLKRMRVKDENTF